MLDSGRIVAWKRSGRSSQRCRWLGECNGGAANLRVEPRWRMTSPSLLDFVASIIGGDRAIFGKVVRCDFEVSMLALVQLSTSSLPWRKEARCASQIPAYFVSSSERGWTLG